MGANVTILGIPPCKNTGHLIILQLLAHCITTSFLVSVISIQYPGICKCVDLMIHGFSIDLTSFVKPVNKTYVSAPALHCQLKQFT